MTDINFSWNEFDALIIEMGNLEELIGIVNLFIAEENETAGKAVSAIQSLTNRIYVDLLERQEQVAKAQRGK